MRGGSRTSSSSTPARSRRSASAGRRGPVTTSSRSNGSHVDVWRRYPFHGQERIIQFDLETLEYEKYTSRIENEVTRPAVRAVALIDGEHAPDVVRRALARAALRVGRRDPRRAAARSCGRGEGYGVPLARRASATPRSSSTSPTSRCSGRTSGSAGPRARSPPGSPTSAPTSASTRPSTRRSTCRRSR